VNRRRLSEVLALLPGDKIQVGEHLLEIEIETRDDRPERESQAITGEYAAPSDIDDGSDELTEPGYVPGDEPAPRS
jgi:hypothetical protein